MDIKQHIPLPPPRRIYDFFRTSLNGLATRGLIGRVAVDAAAALSQDCDLVAGPIPAWHEMMSLQIQQPESNASRIWDLAQSCKGMSGRTLRRLPIACLGLHTYSMSISIDDAVTALATAAHEEKLATGGNKNAG